MLDKGFQRLVRTCKMKVASQQAQGNLRPASRLQRSVKR